MVSRLSDGTAVSGSSVSLPCCPQHVAPVPMVTDASSVSAPLGGTKDEKGGSYIIRKTLGFSPEVPADCSLHPTGRNGVRGRPLAEGRSARHRLSQLGKLCIEQHWNSGHEGKG